MVQDHKEKVQKQVKAMVAVDVNPLNRQSIKHRAIEVKNKGIADAGKA
jgi:phosphopantothenate synthetase